VVEQKVFHDLSTGPSNDLRVATAIARDMVTQYGMSEEIGPLALESDKGRALFGRGVEGEDVSQEMLATVAKEVQKIMREAKGRVEKIIDENGKLLDAIANALIEKETLEQKDFENILIAHGVSLKKDSITRDTE